MTSQVLASEAQAQSSIGRLQAEARIRQVLNTSGPRTVFQPMFTLADGALRGFEALSRFDAMPVRSPDVWFAEAAAAGLSTALEIRAMENALAYVDRLPSHAFMSVNLSPATLLAEGLIEALAAVPSQRLVIEITKHAAVADYAVLKRALDPLRQRGVRLAIDDAGAGYSGLNQIVELLPEFIKLDLFLTRGIDGDAVKRTLAAALVSFATQIGACLIAEGVETPSELAALEELGVQYAQGFYLGHPLPLPGSAPDEDTHPGPAAPPSEALGTSRTCGLP